ncbi:MAG: type I-Fv CRISPR-associated protein Cas5fv [Campylobacterota bacterium]|nr:type I-Fv CRISPR-associated protein Cas5fv [Campylobacterota bacterium]
MKIEIEYEASWRNSFLDGDNNAALPKKGRKFIGSITALKKSDNYIQRDVTHNTVMGILNRLIGEQRKLYQARKNENYFFKAIEPLVSFRDDVKVKNSELVYLRNMSGNTDQNSFTGMIKTDDKMFTSDYSQEFWGVLALDMGELLEFIIYGREISESMTLDPLVISDRFAQIGKFKALKEEGNVSKALVVLDKKFEGTNYKNNKDKVVPLNLYCSALYLQLERLSSKYDLSSALTKTGTITGISKRLFTKKDFMNRFTTGEKKKIFGNPYIMKERVKGIGEVTSMLTKASGVLEITIDIPRDEAKELKKIIDNAGVSSFYLGKKGLAYVSNIDTREVK